MAEVREDKQELSTALLTVQNSHRLIKLTQSEKPNDVLHKHAMLAAPMLVAEE
jgi:hypothetical protein